MLSKLASYTLVGIDATPVEVEVDVSFATMPKTVLVGLAETAVKESTHRVERAIERLSVAYYLIRCKVCSFYPPRGSAGQQTTTQPGKRPAYGA